MAPQKKRIPAGQSTGGLLGTGHNKHMPTTGGYNSGKAKIFSPSNRGI